MIVLKYTRTGVPLLLVRLYLGRYYHVDGVVTRFIKSTGKGYNFLDETTNQVVLNHALYPFREDGSVRVYEDGSIRFVMAGTHDVTPVRESRLA